MSDLTELPDIHPEHRAFIEARLGHPIHTRTCVECGLEWSWHPQRHIRFEDKSMCIDKGIADLVLACWELDIATASSCQGWGLPSDGTEDLMYLGFEDLEALSVFGKLVLAGGPRDDVYERIQDGPWEWSSGAPFESDTTREAGGPIEPLFMGHVAFPPADVDEAVRRLRGIAA